jgi:ribonuclease HI
MTLQGFTDGAARGNPGEAGIGVILRDEQGAVLFSMGGYIGKTTNNVAEYTALLALVKELKRFPCTKLIVHSDSELMVRQMRGEYKVKDPGLKRQHRRVKEILETLPCQVEFRHIPREENADADLLANEGIDLRARVTI